MNLEINLLKQKEDEDKDVVGIHGMMNKDNKDHTDHVIQTNDKFVEFEKTNRKKQLELEHTIFLATNLNENNKKRFEMSKEHYNGDVEAFDKMNSKYSDEIKELRADLSKHHKLRHDLERDIQKIKDNMKEAENENEKWRKNEREKRIKEDIEKAILNEDYNLHLEEMRILKDLVEKCEKESGVLVQLKANDPDWQKQNGSLDELLKQLHEKEIMKDRAKYIFMEKKRLLQLADEEKEKISGKKRIHRERLDKLKDDLAQQKTIKTQKISRKIEQQDNPKLAKLEMELNTEKREVNDIKVKCENIRKGLTKHDVESNHKIYYRDKLRSVNEEKSTELNALLSQIDSISGE